ncbi:putative vomeronasal receptor-like protein 4 [Ctenodactylus gundi]
MVLNLVNEVIFFFLSGLGIMGNIFVLASYIWIFGVTENKSVRLILIHLILTNIMTLLSKGVRRTLSDFGVRIFLDDIGCKILYLERVSRGLSICTTTLLTVVQAFTMCPRHSELRRLKPRTVWQILSWLLFFWILNSLISMNLLNFVLSRNMNTSQITNIENYCFFQLKSQTVNWTFLTFMATRDAVFLGAMGGASGYMVFILHKHHQHVLHLQKSKVLYRAPPEIKAAQSVLSLMLCFLFFYLADCIMSLYLMFFLRDIHFTVILQEFLTVGYAIVSPFVLIHREGHLAGCQRIQ